MADFPCMVQCAATSYILGICSKEVSRTRDEASKEVVATRPYDSSQVCG